MFDVSFLELAVVCVVVLLVVGPERLPMLVRDVARWGRKIRRVIVETQYDLEREFNFEEEKRQLKKENKRLSGAINELDDLMKIAPDRDPDNIKPDPPANDTKP
jgi:sec-independent protein translocase protein TatB